MQLPLPENEQRFRYQVLHEFGHVLGCVHEHSSPKAKIEWDEDKVYKYFSKWKKSEISRQVLRRFRADEAASSDFDTSSVIMYPIQAYLVKKSNVKIEYRLNSELSAGDKAFIRRQEKPAIAVGLAEIDLVGERDLRVEAAAPQSDITTSGFIIQTKTWEDSGLCSAAATWFRIDDPGAWGYQTGILDTQSLVSDRFAMPLQNDFTISFATPYADSPPEVILWLRGVHLGGHGGPSSPPGRGLSWGVYLSVHDVVTKGFTLRVKRDTDTLLYRAMVTWVAYRKTNVGVISGVVQSQDIKPTTWTRLKDNRWGFENMVDISEDKKEQGCVAADFRVYAGITSFEFSAIDNLRLHAEVEKLRDGNGFEIPRFWIRMGTWNKSALKSASVSRLAVHSARLA
ncbi:hypothetical protein RB595_010706 [Gaeumannomyces hyphopodioides]